MGERVGLRLREGVLDIAIGDAAGVGALLADGYDADLAIVDLKRR